MNADDNDLSSVLSQTTTLGYDLQVSMAISCIIAWLIPHLYFEFLDFSEYRVELEKQLVTGPTHSARNGEATRATIVGAVGAVGLIGVLYTISAIIVSYGTNNLDRRAGAIITGMGRIMSAVLFLFFSMEIPLWLDVLDEVPQNSHFYKRQVTCNISELRHRVCRSVLRHFLVMYFILLLYFSNSSLLTILRSTVGKIRVVVHERVCSMSLCLTLLFVAQSVLFAAFSLCFPFGPVARPRGSDLNNESPLRDPSWCQRDLHSPLRLAYCTLPTFGLKDRTFLWGLLVLQPFSVGYGSVCW